MTLFQIQWDGYMLSRGWVVVVMGEGPIKSPALPLLVSATWNHGP